MKTYSVLEEETVHSKLLIRKVQKRTVLLEETVTVHFL